MSYHELGDHQQALEYKQKSLAIQQKLFGQFHAKVANGL
jgi:hypothetical protein